MHDAIRTAALAYQPTDLPALHGKFLDAYGVAGWADLPATEPYLWRHLAYHLLAAGRRAELGATETSALLDYRYLRAKLEATDANALLADCDAYLAGGDDEPIRLLRSALELSAHVLAEDKGALAGQLVGRLMTWRKDNPKIRALTDQIVASVGGLYPADLDSRYATHEQAGGALLRTLAGHEDEVEGALALGDGRLLSWSADRTLRLWEEDRTPLAVLRGHEGVVRGALALGDGRLLSWSRDRTLRLWGEDGAPLAALEGHADWVFGALALGDGRLLSWGGRTLRLWGADGAPIDALEQDYYRGDRAAISAWAARHGYSLADLYPPEEIDPLMAGGRVAKVGRAALRLYHPQTGEHVHTFYGDAEFGTGPVVLDGGRIVAVGDKVGRVLILRWHSGDGAAS